MYGRVYVPSAAVQLTLQDGSIQTLPVVEGFFLGTVGRDLTIAKVAAYNSAGEQTAKTTLR